jgi:hypothetical protein
VGLEIDREEFDDADRERFAHRLARSLEALRSLVDRPGFGVGPPSVGAELELALVDGGALPFLGNQAVLDEVADPRLCLEVDRFNLEINARPTLLAGRPFTTLAADLGDALAATRRAAAKHGARVATVGILPTLEERDLDRSVLSDARRYRALSASLRRLRQGPFRIEIDGGDSLTLDADDVTLEGANTSFQIHLRVDPADYARTYNAAQLATGPALAIAGNSPTFLGRTLWEETRIALFRQSVDDRFDVAAGDWRPARVSFGHGWVRRGAVELFEEVVAMHTALLPITGEGDPLDELARGATPGLAELRLHNGTVWRWNRPVYDPDAGGHLRVELRALPAGPTVTDAVANAAFFVGLTLGLAPRADRLVHHVTFGQARRNFYEAARYGLSAELLWPCDDAPSPRPVGAKELALDLLHVARAGLDAGGVDEDEIDAWLGVVERRAETGNTGAAWQRRALARLGASIDGRARMLDEYQRRSESGDPVHRWADL